MKHNLFIRFLSFVLVLALMLQIIPAQALAVFAEPAAEVSASQEPAANENSVSVVGEIDELRSETTKHFRLSDGSNIAVNYGVPVHYQDETGSWKDMDASVIREEGEGGGRYRFSNNGHTVSFSETLSSGTIFTATHEDVSVSMSLLDEGELAAAAEESAAAPDSVTPSAKSERKSYSRTSTAHWEESDMSFREQKGGNGLDHRELISDSFRKSLRYENVYPDTDLCYTTYGGSIKEQILVNAPQESYRYDFLLELEGLTAALNDDGSVSLLDAECKEVYSIPAPYMEDSAGNFSEAVQYALTETEKGTVLSVEADAQWINAEGRAFPVMIDPTLKESATASKKKIYTTYVSEAAPTESFYDQTSQYSGVKDSSAFEYRTFMHFEALPEVPAGSVIINAYLSYFLNYSIFSDLTELNIGAYEVTGDKPDTATYLSWFQGLTWNNQPAYNSSNIIDYAKLTGSSGSEYINWDLTELVKRWYAENKDNKTIALVATDADSHTSSSYSYAKFLSSYCPVMYVTYRSTIGMESYYTYASLGAGAAGSAYIADATGQLTIARELVGYASTINPVNVNLVYNSDYFSSSSITSYVPPEELGLNMDLGHGWTLDVIQKIEDDPIGDIKYKKYTDGDGTVHYFQQDRTKDPTGKYYYDEDGLGLKIEETSTNCYILSDDSGNQWHFVNNFLIAVEDSNENFIRINYADGRLTTVSQINKGNDEYRVATFEYAEDDANRLVKVTDAAGVVYDLVYDNNRLFEIHRNGVAIARYVYMGNRVRKLTDVESNYSLYFAYDTNGRIGSYQELVGVAPDTGSTGAAVSVEHPDYEKTLYRDHGADRTEKTDDDILTYYIFDNAGRTVNAYTTDADNNILGASSAVYFQNSETDKRNNRTLRTSTIGVTGQQLIRNGGFESTSDSLAWTLNNFTLVQANPRTGTKSLRTILTGEHTVYAKRMSEALEAGKTYTFSVYVNTVEVEDFLGKGVYLQVTDTSGNKWVSEPIAHTTYNAMDGGWLRLNLTFTAQNDGKHTLSIYNHGATGMLYVDDVQLEEGEAPSSHNLVENGSMEMDGYPWIRASGNETYSTEEHIGGSYSMKVVGDPAKLTTRFFQDIPLNLPGTETYVLAGWAKANAVPDNVTEAEDADADTQKQFGLRAVIFYTDDTAETHYTAFSASTDEWQYTSAAIVPEESSKTVEKIRLFCTYEGNANVAYFDNIALLREAARTMRYDEEGNLISVTTTGMAADENGYDTENRLSQITTAGNGIYSYAYDNEYHPFSPTSVTLKDKDGNTVLTESVVYTATGNVKSTTLSGTGKWSLESSATYAESNRVVTATDANGSTVSYGYAEKKNKVTGLPSSVTDALGTLTHTSYDENNRVSRTWIANTANLVYNYTKGNLSSVERTDIDYDSATNTSSYTHQTYNFTYDIWGNMLTTSVGGHTLATNTYYDGNGNLKSQTYANGDSVSYTYDDLGRIKTATYSDGRTLEYIYSGEGYLHSIVETEDGVTTNDQFRYDSIGRITDSQRSIDGTIYTVEDWKYNMYNQLMRQSWKVDGATYTELYTYNNDGDGSLATVTLDGATPVTRTYGYDSLRRLSSITGTVNARKYLYRNIDDDTSTNQVASLSYTGLTGTPAFQYTYDANGNIKTYAAPDSAVVTYTYDAQGQLTEATDGTTTYTYTYDNVGNILTASNGYKNHTYTYSTDNWKDLLTKYDGETITYDASGNPTSYYNGTRWTFGWENGRELASATNGTTNITYDYDANGLRTKKVVDGVTYTYLYDSSRQLRRMTFKGNILDFFYEADGTPNALKFNGTFFYYVTNLQGDVVGIVDGDGNDAATYAYDPYGKLIGGGSSGETDTLQPLVSVAEVNPLRYRGYVYDNETGLYYVSSRYYDPEIGRWINTDTTDVLSLPYYHPGQYNLFSYCNNNPVNDRDDDGQLSWLAKIAIGAAAIAIGVGVTALTGGAALPALVAGVKAACVAGAISAGTSAATTAVRSAVSGDSFSTVVQKSAKAAVDGFADGFMAGGIAAGASQVASGGFKIAAKLGAKTGKNGGIKIGNTKILSPDAAWHKNNGGTLLKIGKTFRIDVGSNSLLHMHLPNVSSHIQIGTIGAGICGGLK